MSQFVAYNATDVGLPISVDRNFSEMTPVEMGSPSSTNDSLSVGNAAESEHIRHVLGPRFIPYSVFATLGVCFNVLSLLAMQYKRGYKTVHHVLLHNLAVCDMMGSVCLWMYYNSPLLFPRFKITALKHCLFVVMALVAPFILSLCISLLSLLMLALNQYIAICSPLFSTANVTKGKILLCIMLAWTVSLTLSLVPGFALLFMARFEDCNRYANSMAVKSIEICSYALVGMIIIIVALYARIYLIIVNYRKHTPSIIRRNRNNGADTESNYKAFMTTLLLTGTLVIFWLPYLVFHFITAHINVDYFPYSVVYIKLYLIDFLPMCIFITDPIIYGIRMKEIRFGYRRLFSVLLPCCVKKPSQANFRTTIKFTTIDNTSI